jgi:hypothetical protein
MVSITAFKMFFICRAFSDISTTKSKDFDRGFRTSSYRYNKPTFLEKFKTVLKSTCHNSMFSIQKTETRTKSDTRINTVFSRWPYCRKVPRRKRRWWNNTLNRSSQFTRVGQSKRRKDFCER